MRLSRIEKPKNILVRIAYWFSKREYGKVVTPLQVVYARNPGLLHVVRQMNKMEQSKLGLPSSYQVLIYVYCSFLNGCHFCQDLWLANAVKTKLGAEKFQALSGNPIDSSLFSEKELAIIAFVKDYSQSMFVSEEVFNGLKMHFSDDEIVEILSINAFECFYSALLVPLGLQSDGLERIASAKT